jgi:hypothetical protein
MHFFLCVSINIYIHLRPEHFVVALHTVRLLIRLIMFFCVFFIYLEQRKNIHSVQNAYNIISKEIGHAN